MSIRSVRRWLLALALGALALALLTAPLARAFSTGQAASLVLGQGTFTADTSATNKRLGMPRGVAVDPVTGAVFVADTSDHRVLRYTSQAALIKGAAAEGVLGQADLFSHIKATSAQGMSEPRGLAVDAAGRLWVADFGNSRVLRFDNAASKPNGAPADGVLGQPDFTSGVGAGGAQGLRSPSGVALDAGGRLWVADTGNHRVLRFDNAASKPNGAPADGAFGQPNFTGDTAALTARGMNTPEGVTVDAGGRLWVADTENNRVLRFDSATDKRNGAPADGVLGQPDFTSSVYESGAEWTFGPTGLAVDGDGRLWVADTVKNRVLRFDAAASKPNGAPAESLLGEPDFFSTDGGGSARTVYTPVGLALDAGGRLWVADSGNRRVLRFDNAASKPIGAAAESLLGQRDFNISPWWYISAEELFTPTSVAVDPTTGKVFVADSSNSRVLRFASRTSLFNGAPAEGVLGQPDFTSYVENPYFREITGDWMFQPQSVAVDAEGRLWVADTGLLRVLRFDNAASKPNGAPADGVLGQPDFTSHHEETSAAGMSWPFGVAVDAGGRLWVADNDRVLRFDNAAAKPNGAPADGVLGQPDFTSGDSATTQQGMTFPMGMALDADGRLWVADNGNHRVLRFDNAASKPNGAPADGVLGQPDFTSALYRTSAEGLISPRGVGVDTQGRLWVADTNNNRVLWFDAAAAKPNGAPADGVLGQPDFTSATNQRTAQGMYQPNGVTVDASGSLWVADSYHNRVLIFDKAGPPTSTPTPSPTGPASATPTPTNTPTPTPALAPGLTRTGGPANNPRCEYAAGQFSFTGAVGLPPGYQSAKLQVSWYTTQPADKRTSPVYQMQTVQHGAQISVPVSWPGIDPGDKLVHVYIGSVLLDPLTLKPIAGMTKSFSDYWTPRVCAAPTPAP